MRKWLPLIALAAVGALFGLGVAMLIVNSSPNAQSSQLTVPQSTQAKFFRVREGVTAPDFSLKTPDGKVVSLSDLRGKRVLVNFWASWCPPCVAETRDLIAAYDQLKDKNVEFVGIGTEDSADNLAAFARNSNVPYTILIDEDSKVSGGWGVLGLPMSMILDEKGVVTKVKAGAVTKDDVLGYFK